MGSQLHWKFEDISFQQKFRTKSAGHNRHNSTSHKFCKLCKNQPQCRDIHDMNPEFLCRGRKSALHQVWLCILYSGRYCHQRPTLLLVCLAVGQSSATYRYRWMRKVNRHIPYMWRLLTIYWPMCIHVSPLKIDNIHVSYAAWVHYVTWSNRRLPKRR